ncbi:MAG: dihydrolipoyl dehydrogenase [bacterium]|nr:dihydrolipoyl dehydrogenase [bacterium]
MFDYHTLIIGAGPAGTSCALKLGRAGKKVGLIEKTAIGGVCLNRGCIPSKTYLYMVELLDCIKKAKRHGIEVAEPKVLWDQVQKRKETNVKVLGMGLTKEIEHAGVAIITAEAKITGPNEVTLAGAEGQKKLTAEHIVFAPGSKSLFLPTIVRGEHVISSTEILDIPGVPQSLAIIGGGVTGVEMASVFLALGTEVTIVEKQEALLPSQDREISANLKKAFEKKGCIIHLGAEVLSCADKDGQAQIIFKTSDGQEQTQAISKALVVIGRAPNYDLKELETVGIEHNGRRIKLNEHLQTSVPSIYVTGDAGFLNLTAYGSEREGQVAAEHILGNDRSIHYEHIMTTVFSHPEVAGIGLTEEQTKAKGIDYEVRRGDYAANAKAVIIGEREGMAKIIVEKATQKILGVHMIGYHATELAHQAILAVTHQLTVRDWLEVVWSHPVLSEVLKSALEAPAEGG